MIVALTLLGIILLVLIFACLKVSSDCSRQEEQESDTPGSFRVCTQYGGQPDHQQTSAAYPQSGEKAKDGAYDQGQRKAIQDTGSLPR